MELKDRNSQQEAWDIEHGEPHLLLQMDSDQASSGVIKFFDWLKVNGKKESLSGLEMCCGKGRNVIWLANNGITMAGFDFSPNAITEAKKRCKTNSCSKNTHFFIQDATSRWDCPNDHFDFIIDCFATTDIDSAEGRKAAVSEALRVLKPGGYMLSYVMSTEDLYHKEMIAKHPAHEERAFLHPDSGKFEKVFTREELVKLYGKFELVTEERIAKNAIFFGKAYPCNHHWMIFKKL